ncbi:MAG TPA: AMP-binding protein [Solirubrobacteraceae bacterium]|nr:AMP-binding protein [Solirubrobacteraceae bacterium]
MQVADLIRRAGAQFGDRPALVHGARTMSFAELDAQTDRLGRALLARGLAPGDRVAALMPNGIDGIVAYYALAKSGLVRLPLNARETPTEHAHKLADSGARALIAPEDVPGHDVEVRIGVHELPGMIERAGAGVCAVARPPGVPLRLAYTGGTTGAPKAVMLTDGNEMCEIAAFLCDLLPGLTPNHTMLHAAPVTHGSGAFLLPHLVRGARNVVLERFSAEAWLDAAERERATATFMVPTMLAMLLEEPATGDASLAITHLCYGGAPTAPTLLRRALDTLGPVLAQTYGQAEAPLAITLLRPDEHDEPRLTSAGRPYTFVEAEIFGEDGEPVGPGETGEVVSRGPHVMQGYWNDPQATAETIDERGWLHTGDLGRWDEEGYLHLVDRRHDVIISGGFNVYPREVEDTLLTHPAIVEAAVVGVPDERWGERIAAAVVARGPVTPQELEDHCRDRLAGFKRPRHIELWDELPRSPVGKSLRREVREAMVNT